MKMRPEWDPEDFVPGSLVVNGSLLSQSGLLSVIWQWSFQLRRVSPGPVCTWCFFKTCSPQLASRSYIPFGLASSHSEQFNQVIIEIRKWSSLFKSDAGCVWMENPVKWSLLSERKNLRISHGGPFLGCGKAFSVRSQLVLSGWVWVSVIFLGASCKPPTFLQQ